MKKNDIEKRSEEIMERRKGEPMSDLISRQAAIDAIDKALSRTFIEPCGEMILKDLPSAQLERKKGEWEICEDADGIYGICSVCGVDADFSHYGEPFDYCPNCGAKMSQETDDE